MKIMHQSTASTPVFGKFVAPPTTDMDGGRNKKEITAALLKCLDIELKTNHPRDVEGKMTTIKQNIQIISSGPSTTGTCWKALVLLENSRLVDYAEEHSKGKFGIRIETEARLRNVEERAARAKERFELAETMAIILPTEKNQAKKAETLRHYEVLALLKDLPRHELSVVFTSSKPFLKRILVVLEMHDIGCRGLLKGQNKVESEVAIDDSRICFLYGGEIAVFQPDACLAEMLFHDDDAGAQVDALRALAERPLKIQVSVKVTSVYDVRVAELPVRVLGDCLRGTPALHSSLPHPPAFRTQADSAIAQWQNNKAPKHRSEMGGSLTLNPQLPLTKRTKTMAIATWTISSMERREPLYWRKRCSVMHIIRHLGVDNGFVICQNSGNNGNLLEIHRHG